MAGKKAQSAMEFLMTYGWAILIMLVVIAILFMLGVFTPETAAPNACVLPQGFSCYGYAIGEGGTFALDVGQATGGDIVITRVGCSAKESDPTMQTMNARVVSGSHKNLTTLPRCEKEDGSYPEGGEYYRGTLYVEYLDDRTGIYHKVKGDIAYKVEKEIEGGEGTPTPTQTGTATPTPTATATPTPGGLTIDPDSATVQIGSTERFRAYDGGTEVTDDADWSVTGGIGTVETTGQSFPGLFTGTDAGDGYVTAEYGLLSGFAPVTVEAGPGEIISFTGNSMNFTCCGLWCCYSTSLYCSQTSMGCSGTYPGDPNVGSYWCTPAGSVTWIDLCGEGDFLQWTTPSNLASGTYTVNGLAACAAWGGCASPPSCTANLYVDGGYETTFTFTDTNTGDHILTPSTYSYDLGPLTGSHTLKVAFTNDCFIPGSGDDRNFFYHDINLVKTS